MHYMSIRIRTRVNIMSQSDSENTRVTITLKAAVYEKIKVISARMGLRPSTWISMVTTSKANDIDMEMNHRGE